jgi:hypothetical protein
VAVAVPVHRAPPMAPSRSSCCSSSSGQQHTPRQRRHSRCACRNGRRCSGRAGAPQPLGQQQQQLSLAVLLLLCGCCWLPAALGSTKAVNATAARCAVRPMPGEACWIHTHKTHTHTHTNEWQAAMRQPLNTTRCPCTWHARANASHTCVYTQAPHEAECAPHATHAQRPRLAAQLRGVLRGLPAATEE